MNKIMLSVLFILIITSAYAVLPKFEVGEYDPWSACRSACRAEFNSCDLACSDSASAGKDMKTIDETSKVQAAYWACAHGSSPGVAGGCDAALNGCYASCDSWTDIPTDLRPDPDTYRDDELGIKPESIPEQKPVVETKPEEKNNDNFDPDENGEGCPRYCSGDILMSNGRKGDDGTCWYNPFRCERCSEILGWSQCVDTEETVRSELKRKIWILENEWAGITKDLHDVNKLRGMDYELDLSKFAIGDNSDNLKLPESIDALSDLFQQYEQALAKERKILESAKADIAEIKIEKDYAEKKLPAALDKVFSQSDMTGMYRQLFFDGWTDNFAKNNDPDESVTDAMLALPKRVGEAFTGLGATYGAEAMLSSSQENARKVMADGFKKYMETAYKLEQESKEKNYGVLDESEKEKIHKKALEAADTVINSDDHIETLYGAATTRSMFDKNQYGSIFESTYNNKRIQLEGTMKTEYWYDKYGEEYKTEFDIEKEAKLRVLEIMRGDSK